jgi:hypothetical protein
LKSVLDAVAVLGVNVEGVCAEMRPGETWGYVHLLVEDGEGSKAAIEKAGFEVRGLNDVEVFDIENRPGALAEAVGRFSDEGLNIEVLYFAGAKLVIGAENMHKDIPGVRMEDARYT